MAPKLPIPLVVAAVTAFAACGTSTTEVLSTGGGSTTGPGTGATTGTTTGTVTGSTTGADGGTVACKRGMAYGGDSVADLTSLSKGISWWYNWAAKPDNAAVASAHDGIGVEYVPMAWGQASLANLATQVAGDAHALLGFNEPNFGSQANLTPTQAAMLWPQVEAVAQQKGLKIVSPALNYCGSPCNVTNPFDWLDQFFAACTGCQVDYIALHWYACSGSALTSYIQEAESKYTQDIWLTEFSCADSSDTSEPAQESYMKTALAILEADPRIHRYSWFTGRSTSNPAVSLLDADAGALTPLGEIYVSYPQSCKP